MQTSKHFIFRGGIPFFFAGVLFITLFLHTAHFNHDHAKEIFGEGQIVIMHASNKEESGSLGVPFPDVSPAVFPSGTFSAPYMSPLFGFFAFFLYKIFDPLREALRRGILQPKLYA